MLGVFLLLITLCYKLNHSFIHSFPPVIIHVEQKFTQPHERKLYSRSKSWLGMPCCVLSWMQTGYGTTFHFIGCICNKRVCCFQSIWRKHHINLLKHGAFDQRRPRAGSHTLPVSSSLITAQLLGETHDNNKWVVVTVFPETLHHHFGEKSTLWPSQYKVFFIASIYMAPWYTYNLKDLK